MTSVEDAVEARISKNGENFEILVDCEKALQYRSGVMVNLDEVLVTEDIFTDSSKGLKASQESIENAFGTSNTREVAQIIIKQGHVNLTTEYRQKLKEQKTKRVIDIISSRACDPKTGNPHPAKRIENAMEVAKVSIDIFKNEEDQAKEVVEKIRSILPISMKEFRYEIQIPALFAGRAYHAFRNIGSLVKQEWQSNGSLILEIEIPAGQKEALFSKANELTHGDVEIKQVS